MFGDSLTNAVSRLLKSVESVTTSMTAVADAMNEKKMIIQNAKASILEAQKAVEEATALLPDVIGSGFNLTDDKK